MIPTDSDIPDNYVCVEGKKGRNYLDTIVDSKIVDYMSKHGEKFSFHKTNPEYLVYSRCHSNCRKYTCDEIKNGAVGKEREKARNDCREKYKKIFDENPPFRIRKATKEVTKAHYHKERERYVSHICKLNMRSANSRYEDKVEECFGCDTSKKCNLNNL